MKVGLQQVFQNHGRAVSDGQIVEEEIALGLMAEELGFDELWPVEHHFSDYAACPDNTQFLAYMAARTSRIKLATGAVILPWNQPVRVAEKLIESWARYRLLLPETAPLRLRWPPGQSRRPPPQPE